MWAAFSIDQWINIAAAFGQVAAALLAVVALIISISTSRAQQKLAERIAGEEQAMLFEQVRNQRDSDVIRWSEACVHTLAEIESLVAHPPAEGAVRERNQLLARLSASIDHGRLFFPNQQPDKKGTDKPAAFQGFRQKILAVLVAAHHVLSREDALVSETARATAIGQIGELRRVFISEAQLAIDPRRFIALKEMNEIRAGRGLAPQSFEGSDLADAYKQS
ncbi:MAG: hypothetical protein U1E49_00410 [Hyphomicrobiaceae bacterium]